MNLKKYMQSPLTSVRTLLGGFVAGVVLFVSLGVLTTGYEIQIKGPLVEYTPIQQTASAGALTDYAENKIVDATLRGQALGAPATWYYALYTTCPTDSTAGTEVTGGSYARVAVTAGLTQFAGTQAAASTTASTGTGGTTSNNAVVTFTTPTAGWGTVNCWGLVDALTAGNIWIYSALTIPKTINNGDLPSFAAGATTIQIDN